MHGGQLTRALGPAAPLIVDSTQGGRGHICTCLHKRSCLEDRTCTPAISKTYSTQVEAVSQPEHVNPSTPHHIRQVRHVVRKAAFVSELAGSVHEELAQSPAHDTWRSGLKLDFSR